MLQARVSKNSFYCSITQEGSLIDFSPSWVDFLQIGQLELLKNSFQEFIHPDDLGTLAMALEQSVHQRYPYEVPLKIQNKLGESKLIDFSILYQSRESRFVIFGDDNTLYRQLSHRHEAMKKLNEETFKISFWQYDLDSQIFHGEFQDQAIKKQASKEDIYSLFLNFVDPSEKDHLTFVLTHLFENGKRFESTFQSSEFGKSIQLNGKLDQHANCIVGFLRDVSDTVNREKVYLDKNLELSSFEKGLDKFTIVARTDAEGRITYANEAFCAISKYTIDELLGKDHRILNSGHHPREFFTKMWNDIKAGKSWRNKVKNKAKDGSFYWVDTIIIPIMNSNGQLMEILSFRFEITQYINILSENKRLKELLDKA